MMATDVVMILLAFGLALALRVAVVAKIGTTVWRRSNPLLAGDH